MLFIKGTDEYPRFIGDVQLDDPSYTEGGVLPAGWHEVTEADYPTVGEDEIAYEDLPVEVDGVLTQNWQVRAMTAEEIERRDAPITAKQKLIDLGLSEVEIQALVAGMVR